MNDTRSDTGATAATLPRALTVDVPAARRPPRPDPRPVTDRAHHDRSMRDGSGHGTSDQDTSGQTGPGQTGPGQTTSERGPSVVPGPSTGSGPGERSGAAEAVAVLVGLPAGHPSRPAALEAAVAAHLPLVAHLARRFTDRGEPQDDLTQVGTIGLLRALERFDPDRGVAFSSYAVPTIVGEIKRHFRDRGWAVRVPRGLQDLGRSLSTARASLTTELGRSPTVSELATRVGCDPEQVMEALESTQAYATVPLDAPGGPTYETLLAGPDLALEHVETREALRPLLNRLPAREQQIVALRFLRGMSQSQIAAEVGISQMHVSRLLHRSLQTLRAGLTSLDQD